MSDRVLNGPAQPQGVGEDPLTHYTRVFVKFFQVIFSTFEKGAYRWSADPRTTEVTISDQGGINKEVVERRPAIVVQRGPMALTNVSMNQMSGPVLGQDGKLHIPIDLESGKKRYTDLCSGSLVVNCLSSNGIEAQRLAWVVAYAIRTLKTTLHRAGMHRVGEDLSVTGETPPGALVQGDPGEIIMVSVNVPFYFQLSWSIEPLDKTLLTHIDFALRSEVRGPVLKPPSMNGQPLNIVKSVRISQKLGPNSDGGSEP